MPGDTAPLSTVKAEYVDRYAPYIADALGLSRQDTAAILRDTVQWQGNGPGMPGGRPTAAARFFECVKQLMEATTVTNDQAAKIRALLRSTGFHTVADADDGELLHPVTRAPRAAAG